ncbi:MAG: hypothetical protein AAFX92_10325 [Pseudomonadota bacterium]
MRILVTAPLCLSIAAPGWTQVADVKPDEVNSIDFYADAEARLLAERQALLDQESAMEWPLWIGQPGMEIIIVEEAEYRRVLGLLRDWTTSGLFEHRGIEYLPALDRYLFETLGIEAIANMDAAALDLHVAQARANRDRLLSVFDAALDYTAARVDYLLAVRQAEAQPDIYRVFTSTYGEIHWQEGYYDEPNNTIAIEDIYEDRDRAVWVVEGSWGRLNDPDRHGGFEFLFSSPCQFAGRWWYSGSDAGAAVNWTGECQ